jgi:hypothetical protein
VSRARQAAAEELGHAVASGEVAASLGGMTCVSLDPPLTQPRPVASGVEGLRRLALESWSDGCIGESASALIARRECAQAGDPAIARVQALIALQESNHAELAWEVVEWALGADRASVGPLLAASAVVAPMSNQGGATTTSGDGLSAFGIVPAASAGALQDQALARAHAHLTERLGG